MGFPWRRKTETDSVSVVLHALSLYSILFLIETVISSACGYDVTARQKQEDRKPGNHAKDAAKAW